MYVRVSELLQDKIDQAMAGNDSCVYRPECTLHNPDTGFSFTTRNVRSITILQDFVTNYMDNITVSTDITPTEYQDIMSNIQNLECCIILTPQNVYFNSDIIDQDPIIIEMMVFLPNQEDIEKTYNINTFAQKDAQPETPSQAGAIFTYTFNLISKEMHDIRQINLNAILKSCTMEDVLYWACQQFGVTNVELISPDNTETYDAIIIPPMHNFATLFPYLQERYGIYSKGLGYYYTGDTLYIYPQYDVSQDTATTDGVVQLIKVPENMLLGNDRYHAQVDDDILIASITRVITTPRNAAGAENIGTTHISTNSDSLRDQFVTIGTDGKVTRSSNDITTIALQNGAGNATSNMQNVRYAGERTNIYSSTAALAEINGTTLFTGWNKAVPWLIVPGQNVTFHFDSTEAGYRTQKGRIQRIFFGSSSISDASNEPNIAFVATLEVFLEPDQQDAQSVQYV